MPLPPCLEQGTMRPHGNVCCAAGLYGGNGERSPRSLSSSKSSPSWVRSGFCVSISCVCDADCVLCICIIGSRDWDGCVLLLCIEGDSDSNNSNTMISERGNK
jgi:hypothetical protein